MNLTSRERDLVATIVERAAHDLDEGRPVLKIGDDDEADPDYGCATGLGISAAELRDLAWRITWETS